MDSAPQLITDDVALAKAVNDLWPRYRMTFGQAAAVLARFRRMSIQPDHVIGAVRAVYEDDPDRDKPSWTEIERRIRTGATGEQRANWRRDDEADPERTYWAQFPEPRTPWEAELWAADAAGRLLPEDWKNWTVTLIERQQVVARFGHLAWPGVPYSDAQPDRRPPWIKHARDNGRLEREETAHFHVRNLRTFGDATTAFRDKWRDWLAADLAIVKRHLEEADAPPPAPPADLEPVAVETIEPEGVMPTGDDIPF